MKLDSDQYEILIAAIGNYDADNFLTENDKWEKIEKIDKILDHLKYDVHAIKTGLKKIKLPDLHILEKQILAQS